MQPEFLKIAFATPKYVTEDRFDGCLAQYIHRVARALAVMGHDVHVITASEIDDAIIQHHGITVHRVTSGRIWKQINRLTRYTVPSTMYQFDLSVQFYRKLKQLSEKPFDLVQVPNFSFCGLVSTVLDRKSTRLNSSHTDI